MYISKPPRAFYKAQILSHLTKDMANILQFFREAYAELIRVSWPTREQTIQYTVLVIIISLLVAAFLGTLDYFFGNLVSRFLF